MLTRSGARKSVVMALGGGAFTQAINRELVAQMGISIWLDAPFALCWQRIQSDTVVRPLAPTREEAYLRYQQRSSIYQQAQLRVTVTPEDSPASLVPQILAQLHLA